MRANPRQILDRYPAARFPVQHEIQELEKELSDFNDRIIELENAGHHGRAMDVLKANAMDFAQRIDELRCVLADPPRAAPS
jgi:hypothetical protein